jgi:Fe2+ or Zn2+ uptake regulation protein
MQKQTRQRQAILNLIQQADEHLTAAQVYERVRQVLPTIGFATVYRNLNAMAEEGVVRVIRVGDVSQYDRRTERHDHVVCRRCGKVADVQLPVPAETLAAAAAETGFRIDEHHTELSGLCPGCR